MVWPREHFFLWIIKHACNLLRAASHYGWFCVYLKTYHQLLIQNNLETCLFFFFCFCDISLGTTTKLQSTSNALWWRQKSQILWNQQICAWLVITRDMTKKKFLFKYLFLFCWYCFADEVLKRQLLQALCFNSKVISSLVLRSHLSPTKISSIQDHNAQM